MARTLVGRLQLVVQAMGLGEAKKVENTISSIEKAAKRLSSAPWGQGFQRQIEKMALSARELEAVRLSWGKLQRDFASRNLTAALKKSEISAWKTATLGELASVRAGMRKTELEAKRLGTGMRNALKPLYVALGGYTGVYMAGMFGREAIAASAERQREYFRQRMANIPEGEQETIFRHSQDLSAKYPSVNITDIMEMARTARNTMGSTDRGMEVLDRMVQGFVTLQSAKGVEAATSELTGLMKGLDNLGTNSNGAEGIRNVNNLIDAFIKAAQIEGNDFDVGSIWSFARRSRIAGPGLSPEFLATIAPAMIQDMGADGAGTALNMAYKALVIGSNDAGSKDNIAAQRRLGLRQGEGKGDLVDSDLFGTNPYAWVKKNLMPALVKDGVDLDNDTAVAKAVAQLSRNSSATGFLTRMITQRQQNDRLVGLYQRAMGVEAADTAAGSDPFVAWRGFQESLRNLSASVGETVMPVIVPALNSLANTINSFAAAVQAQDPRVLTGAGIAAAGVAGYGAYKAVSGIWALTTAGASLQTAAVMLQEAAIAQGGGGIAKDGAKAAGWGASTLSLIGAAAAATLNIAQSDRLKASGEVDRKNREQRALDAYFANKKTSSWREFLFGDAAKPGFSLRDSMKMDIGGKLPGPVEQPNNPFGEMLSGMEINAPHETAPAGVNVTAPGATSTDAAMSNLDSFVQKSQEAGAQAKDALSITATPKVDSSAVDSLISKINQAVSALQRLSNAASQANSGVDAQIRRAHADYGVAP